MSVNKRSLDGLKLCGVEGDLEIKKQLTMPEKKRDPKALVAPEKVTEIWGASAGAGSDYFHGYRKKRDFQLAREAAFEKEAEEEADYDEHQAKRLKGMAEADAATNKKRDKRKRRKEAKVRNKLQKEQGENINAFKSGNFMEQAKKLLEQSKKEGKDKVDLSENLTEEQVQAKAAVPVSFQKMNNMEANISIKEVNDD